MSLSDVLLQNIQNENETLYTNVVLTKDKSISKFIRTFISFWDLVKIKIQQGETKFNFVINTEYQLPFLLLILKKVSEILETETLKDYENLVAVLREIESENLEISIFTQNGGLTYLSIVPADDYNSLFEVIDIIPVNQTPS